MDWGTALVLAISIWATVSGGPTIKTFAFKSTGLITSGIGMSVGELRPPRQLALTVDVVDRGELLEKSPAVDQKRSPGLKTAEAMHQLNRSTPADAEQLFKG
jgi:hypothetical protein